MIDYAEFLAAQDLIEKWVGKMDDPQASFGELDHDGSAQIDFDEFCMWAMKKNLSLEGL